MEQRIGQWVMPGMKKTDTGDFKRLLLNESMVLRVERKEFDYRSKKTKYFSYQRGEGAGLPINSPTANYVIGVKPIVDKELSDNRHLQGGTVTISEASTGLVIATLTYFSSRYPAAYCGQGIGEFDLPGFVSQAYEK